MQLWDHCLQGGGVNRVVIGVNAMMTHDTLALAGGDGCGEESCDIYGRCGQAILWLGRPSYGWAGHPMAGQAILWSRKDANRAVWRCCR